MADNITETIGCDLGDKTSELFILGSDDKHHRAKVRTTRKGFVAFFTRPSCHVVIEVGSHSRWVAELLGRLGHRVTVANPRRVKLISASDTKTDRRDAELLARLGRADLQLLAPIEHRSNDAQAHLAVAKARDILVVTRTKLVNHVRGTVKSFGDCLPSCDASAFACRTRTCVPESLRLALNPIYDALDCIEQQIRQHDRNLEAVAARYPDVAVISQPKGVGTLTALVYFLTVEDPKRFSKSRMVGAFFGLRPRKSQSGGKDPQLRITKAGDPFTRRLLVTAANYILGPFGQDSDLRRWGLHLASRGGANAKKRAKVAVARKLAVLLHRLWITGQKYTPLANNGGVIAAA